jgi:hypothetical protein
MLIMIVTALTLLTEFSLIRRTIPNGQREEAFTKITGQIFVSKVFRK